MNFHTFTRKLAAILSAEIQGENRPVDLVDEDRATPPSTLTIYQELVASLIHQYQGRMVNSSADNLLAEFDSVVEALRCAVAIQQDLKQRNASLPTRQRIEIGIGLNLGDVLVDMEQVYEEGVNIATYLKSLAEGGGIYISGTVYDQVETKLPLKYEYLGGQEITNIAKPVRVYRVQWETADALMPDEPVLHDQSDLPWTDGPGSTGTVQLVGRDTDLARLQQCLEKAMSGERQVLFLTGEPGIGKTTVVETFLAQLGARDWGLGGGDQQRPGVEGNQQRAKIPNSRSQPLTPNTQPPIPSLLIAQGQCIEHYGAGEAYLTRT